MLDGRKFNPLTMTGKTDEDCEKIRKMLEIKADLYVDKHMRVVADSVLYIADAIEVGPGKGVVYQDRELFRKLVGYI